MNEEIYREKEKVVKNLSVAGAIYLRGLDNEDGDMDFFVYRERLRSLHKELLTNGYELLHTVDADKCTYYKIIACKVLRVDVEMNLNYIFRYFPYLSFKQEFVGKYISSPQCSLSAFRTIRNIVLFRHKKKYMKQIDQYRDKLDLNNIFKNALNETPFRKNVGWKKLSRFQEKKWWTIALTLKPKHLFGLLLSHAKLYRSLFLSGQTVAFIGPDGSGKSTIILIIKSLLNSQRIYMGTNELIMGRLYPKLRGNNFILTIKFFLIYLENILRYVKAIYGKIIGRTVLMDRYPTYQHLLQNRGHGKKLSELFYSKLYPLPDKIVVLENDPQTIFERKKDLSIEEIQLVIKLHRQMLGGHKNVLFVENSDIKKTIPYIISFLTK
jgi:thymidylate kinase